MSKGREWLELKGAVGVSLCASVSINKGQQATMAAEESVSASGPGVVTAVYYDSPGAGSRDLCRKFPKACACGGCCPLLISVWTYSLTL